MDNYRKILIAIGLIFVFLLVYSPHFDYAFPFHIDEWRHITETKRLTDAVGNASNKFGLELGFHLLLLPLEKITNLVLVYKFLPALWASLSALALFWVVYKKTDENFSVAFLAILFFASIKSNVNITGLWFFTPLTFSIPFIFLYIYFFSEGLARQNKKFVIISFAIMTFLLFVHAVSVLFALPMLIIYSFIFYRYFIKEYKFFVTFLALPLIGILFYKFATGVAWTDLLSNLGSRLQFRSGWGILELKNSFLEVYSWFGYLLALAGALFIIINQAIKKYAIYLLWPLVLLISIIIFRVFEISFLSPFQRNIYYLAISLPLLSALGFYFIVVTGKKYLTQLIKDQRYIKQIQSLFIVLFILVSLSLTFTNYYNIPEQVDLYRVINQDDYQTLLFMRDLPKESVMALPFFSTALYPVSGHWPDGAIKFYGNRDRVTNFFEAETCEEKQTIVDLDKKKRRKKLIYLVSPIEMPCGWELIYNKNNNYVYKF